MRSFMGRLLFQFLDYGARGTGPKPKNFKAALIPTMNESDEDCIARGIKDDLDLLKEMIGHTLGSCELLTLTDTVIFDDYSKYVYELPNLEEKSSRIDKISVEDLKKTFELGGRFVKF